MHDFLSPVCAGDFFLVPVGFWDTTGFSLSEIVMKISVPLAEFLRAKTLDDIVGQDHILCKDGLIRQSIARNKALSVLFFGPPGVGKTSIAKLYAEAFSCPTTYLSAVFSGVADIKNIIKEHEKNPLFRTTTIVFLDEIHRFNRAQQDALLPHVESGHIVLIGATTENPSFYLNGALLSRMRVLTLNPLSDKSLLELLARYEKSFSPLSLSLKAQEKLIESCQGDGRYLYNLLENISVHVNENLSKEDISRFIPRKPALYDRASEQHYNLISALHKSVRASDPNAALYWFCRMLEGGEDPLFIARRIIRMASEDIGLADNQALTIAIEARKSYQALGSPEGELALAQAVIYLSLAPKSNSVYVAYKRARDLAKKTTHLSPPKHVLNAPTALLKELKYGEDYIYDHDTEKGCAGQNSFPSELGPREFYEPKDRGFEREMKKRLDYFNKIRKL